MTARARPRSWTGAGAEAAWTAPSAVLTAPAGGTYAVLEAFVTFTREISVIAARGQTGTLVCFEPAENVHTNHILATSTVPAHITPATAALAVEIAARAATALDLVGLLAVEMFRDRRRWPSL